MRHSSARCWSARRRGQVNNAGLRDVLSDHFPGQINPPQTPVENGVVRTRHDLVGCRKNPIGIGHHLDLPWPAVFGRYFLQDSLQAPTIIDRAIEPPVALAYRGIRGKPAYSAERRKCFFYFVVVGIDTGDVPATTVPSDQDNPAAQGGFDGRQNVKPVQPQLLIIELRGADTVRFAAQPGLDRAGTAGNRNPLTPREMITITHQFRGRGDAVSVVQEPAKVAGRLAQANVAAGTEGTLVLRIGASMS